MPGPTAPLALRSGVLAVTSGFSRFQARLNVDQRMNLVRTEPTACAHAEARVADSVRRLGGLSRAVRRGRGPPWRPPGTCLRRSRAGPGTTTRRRYATSGRRLVSRRARSVATSSARMLSSSSRPRRASRSIVSRDTPLDASAPATARRPAPADLQVVLGELPREGPVVEQPDLLETVELRRHLGGLEPRAGAAALELAPRLAAAPPAAASARSWQSSGCLRCAWSPCDVDAGVERAFP